MKQAGATKMARIGRNGKVVANYGASNVEATTGPRTVENPDTRVGIQVISLQLMPGRKIMVKKLIIEHRTEIQR